MEKVWAVWAKLYEATQGGQENVYREERSCVRIFWTECLFLLSPVE